MSQGDSHSGIATAIILAAILLGGILVVTTVDLVECPQCHGNFLLKYLCPLCGHDGKVTILQYLMYEFQH